MAEKDWMTMMSASKIKETAAAFKINDGRPCECGDASNYHASTKQDGKRDGGCRINGCPCVKFKLDL